MKAVRPHKFFPVEPGERWRVNDGELWCVDIAEGADVDELKQFFGKVDLFYCDPPWGNALTKWFYTHAGMKKPNTVNFNRIAEIMMEVIKNGRSAYVEVGTGQMEHVWERMVAHWMKVTEIIETRYADDRPEKLLRSSSWMLDDRVANQIMGQRSEKLPDIAISLEDGMVGVHAVGDLFTGLGTTGLAALKYGKPFFGTELNKYRCAYFLAEAAKRGADVERISQ